MESPQPSQNGLVAAIVFAAVVVSGSLAFLGYQMTDSTIGSADILGRDQLMRTLEQMDRNELAELFKELSSRVTASYDELVDDDPFMGDENAPITIVEFTDYGCYYCHRHYSETLSSLKKDYIDSGKVKYVVRELVYRDLPSALASNCAFDQGGNVAFFHMHDAFFSAQETYDMNGYLSLAQEIGLDVQAFQSCLDSEAYKEEISGDMAAAAALGFTGTPAFVISNGSVSRTVSGAQPLAKFTAIVDELSK